MVGAREEAVEIPAPLSGAVVGPGRASSQHSGIHGALPLGIFLWVAEERTWEGLHRGWAAAQGPPRA